MMNTIEANWLVFALVLVFALALAWWLFRRAATPRNRSYRPDVLDEGQAPAQRNQALIDAAPAARIVQPPFVSDALGGMGEMVAAAAQAELLAREQSGGEPEVPQPADPSPAPEQPVQPDPVPELPGESPAETPQQPQVAPDPVPPQAPATAAAATGDDLSRIKGLGPKLQALLPTLGIATYAQIAALDDTALAELDGKLGAFAGRPRKDNWMDQARYLAAGDVSGFEAQFGKL